MGRHDDDRYDSDSDDEERRSKRKRKHHKSSSRKHEDRKARKKERRRSHSSGDDSSVSSSSDSHARRKDRKRRKKEKKHRKKSERREKKDKKKRSRKEERKKSSKEDHDDSDADSTRLERNYQFTNALQSLLEIQPGMASELPILLIRMADGTSFNLSQMPDARVSARLQQVMASLSPFGVERDATGSWSWNALSGGKKDPLVLLKIARTLLDQIGITMESVNDYEKEKDAIQAEAIRKEKEAQEAVGALNEQTAFLLDQFQKEKGSDGPTLAQELATLCNMILSGESISLDGLPDESLREAIENLFRTAGLEKSEMEDSDDEDEASDDDEPVMGYGLPEGNGSRASANMASILEVCKASATKTATKRAVKGPMMPPQEFAVADHTNGYVDEEDEEGPAPVGSVKATKRVQKGPSLPPEVIKAMAERRKRELAAATGVDIAAQSGVGEREQWMLEPGEHDFLQGIKTGNAIKSRNFENKKKRASATEVAAAAPVDPSVQAEVDAIMELQRVARGPSLMEQHRLKKAEEKAEAAKGGKEDWKWSRDKDLDAGRRVDKNALNMVMGGAAGNLKDKFQGGLSRGFM